MKNILLIIMKLRKSIKDFKIDKYLVVAIVNTLFGYVMGVTIYKILNQNYSIFLISLITSFICINFSFTNYKVFVFKNGNLLIDYIKYIASNFILIITGTFFLWFYMEKIEINIWISQFLLIISNSLFTMITHYKFTFRGSFNKK
jgi:hypothetical protein